MPGKSSTLRITDTEKVSSLELKQLDYLGNGAYDCRLLVDSSGFMCDKPFGFDNDEYFLAKLREVLATHSGEADLMALESDSYLRVQPFAEHKLLVSGLVIEDQPFSQSLEFAFTAEKKTLEKFLGAFEKVVRANT